MARNYAQISTAIWRNDDFRALSVPAQHMYLLLSTQADISAAGMLSLNVTRWSSRAKGITQDDIKAALSELQAHRFIVLDVHTEELLVRSFVRWDGGYNNPKRRPVVLRAAKEVESPLIRRALAAEFERLGLPAEGLTDDLQMSDDTSAPVADAYMGEDLFSQGNSLSGSASSSDGVVVTKALVVDPTTHNPHPPSHATAAAKPRPDHGTRLHEDWVRSDEGHRAVAWAKENYPDVPIVEESLKFTNYWLAKSGKDATKRDWYRTFQNWVMEANRRLSPAGRRDGKTGRLTGGMTAESNAPKNYRPDDRCPKHPSNPKGRCGSCRADQLAARRTA